MKILKPLQNLNIVLNNQTDFKTNLGWSESFVEYENEMLDLVINDIENYETVRYIHQEYDGMTTNPLHTQNDIWFYFYFLSGGTYVQNYEAVGITNSENAKLTKQTTNSFFRLEFFKTPNDESPDRSNRRLIFAKNLDLPIGEKFYLTMNDFNDYVFVPVFIGSNYKNKENMYFYWFQDDTPYDETELTGNTFYMTAKFFNGGDGSILDFTNTCFDTTHEVDETQDMYYKVIIDMNNYSYRIHEYDGTMGDRAGTRSNPIKFYEKGGGNC